MIQKNDTKNNIIITKNKKAMMAISDLFATIIWVLVIIIFSAIFSIRFGGCSKHNPLENKIISSIDYNVEANILLLNFLRTPINNGEISNTDLILAWQSQESNDKSSAEQFIALITGTTQKPIWKERITENAKQYFDTKYGKCYSLFITLDDTQTADPNAKNSIFIGTKQSDEQDPTLPPDITSTEKSDSRIIIPALDETQIYVHLNIKRYAEYNLRGIPQNKIKEFCEIK